MPATFPWHCHPTGQEETDRRSCQRSSRGVHIGLLTAFPLNERGPQWVLSRGQCSLRLLKICLVSMSRAHISGARWEAGAHSWGEPVAVVQVGGDGAWTGIWWWKLGVCFDLENLLTDWRSIKEDSKGSGWSNWEEKVPFNRDVERAGLKREWRMLFG